MTDNVEQVSELPEFLKNTNINFDFFKVRNDLKQYLRNQERFQDYNFDASGMSILLDVLAYNSQMNAMTTHLGINEMFLDSAQARPNVVSAAKNLGYLPRSFSSAKAIINITINPFMMSVPPFATLSEGTLFSGGGYTWTATKTQTVPNINGKFYFENVEIAEGVRKNIRYYYDSRVNYQKFQIPDRDVDISSLIVRVKSSNSSTAFIEYKKFTSFGEINSSTPIYFVQGGATGTYEVYFTNKENIGLSPVNGNVIDISYRRTSGIEANGVSVFNLTSRLLESSEKSTITTIKRSYGGAEEESIESIRHNAPQHFKTQNRCVTTEDYVSIILRDYPGSIESITSWGGEYNSPPEFGRVFIAIKPHDADSLDDDQKRYIVRDILKPKNVATITPFIEDPDYVWIGADVVVKYDQTVTNNSDSRIREMVFNSILKFGEKNLQSFERVFKHSRFLHTIDTTEMSIENSSANIFLIKKIVPKVGTSNQFLLKIPGDLYRSGEDDSLIRTSAITIGGRQHFLVDRKIEGTNNLRSIQMFYFDASGKEVVVQNNVGRMNLIDRTMYLFNIRQDTSSPIRIYFNPNSYDIPPFQNQFLRLDENEINITVESVGNLSSYRAPPRSTVSGD